MEGKKILEFTAGAAPYRAPLSRLLLLPQEEPVLCESVYELPDWDEETIVEDSF